MNFTKIKSYWLKLDKKQKYLAVCFFIAVLIAVTCAAYLNKTDYVPLFTGMDAKDAGEVAGKLKELKVPYEISNGTTILVPAKDVYKVRLDLASQGLPRGHKGFEVFEQSKFGTTDFQNKVYLLQALQGELAKTIEQLSEVESARVHIVLPSDSLYKKNEKPATASIMLKLRAGSELSRPQVKGIVNLVAHSIQGLKAENVTVVDENARVLNNTEDDSAVLTGNRFEQSKKVQEELQRNIQSMLEQVLGPGKSAVRVSVELNFDQRSLDKQTFEPVVDDKGIVRSSQEKNESYKGAGSGPGGVAGTTSNIPGYVTAGTNNQNTYEQKEVTRNYEINETKEKLIVAPGSIKRLSIAVLIDNSISQNQQQLLVNTVSNAVGLNIARGDSISVEQIPFSTELADKQRKEEAQFLAQQGTSFWKIGLITIILIGGAYLIYKRKQKNLPTIEETIISEPQEVKKATVSAEEKELLNQRQIAENLAKTRPSDVAQIIKTWINEE